MPEGVGYGPQNTASTGLTLNTVGSFAYGYSGVVSVSNSLTTMNLFTTGNFVSKLWIELNGVFSQIGQSQIHFEVKIDDSIIIDTYWDAALDAFLFDFPTRLIIPPYTKVEISLAQASGSDRNMETTITGKIYK